MPLFQYPDYIVSDERMIVKDVEGIGHGLI